MDTINKGPLDIIRHITPSAKEKFHQLGLGGPGRVFELDNELTMDCWISSEDFNGLLPCIIAVRKEGLVIEWNIASVDPDKYIKCQDEEDIKELVLISDFERVLEPEYLMVAFDNYFDYDGSKQRKNAEIAAKSKPKEFDEIIDY